MNGQAFFSQKNLSIPIRRIEKLKVNGSVSYWKSSDTTVATILSGTLTPKKIGWTLITAEDSLHATKDSCLISIVPWNASISEFNPELYLKYFRLEGIRNDTLIMQAAGSTYSWSAQYIYHSSMAKPKLLYNFPTDGTFSYDGESALPTPFGTFILAKRETINSPRKIYKTDFQNSSMKVVGAAYPPDSNLVPFSTVMFNGWDSDASLRNIYMGQYTSMDSGYEDYRIKILKYSGDSTFVPVYSFPARKELGYFGGVRHVHAVQTDPYSGDVWIATGDANDQSRIYRNTNHLTPDSSGNAPLELIGVGSPEFRVVSFAFTPKYIYYFMDAPANPQSIFRLPRMASYPTMYDNQPSTLSLYRQRVGTFPDKPFYGNFQFNDNGNNFTIIETAWEDVKHYGASSFREIDSCGRVYALRESPAGDVQVQEICAKPGLAPYSHLYPIGTDSKGYLYFTSMYINDLNYRSIYRGKLKWRELDSVSIVSGQNCVSFQKYNVTLNCSASGKDNICAYKVSAPNLNEMPQAIKGVTDNFWNTYLSCLTFSNGTLSIPISAISGFNEKLKKQFTWVMRSIPGGPWINIGGKIKHDSLVSTIPVSQLNDFGISVLNLPLGVSPDTITVTNPAIGETFSTPFSIYNGTDSTIVIDSISSSSDNISLTLDQSIPFVINSSTQIGTTAVFIIKSKFEDNNSILMYSGGSLVAEIPISKKILNNSTSEEKKSFFVSAPYPNPFNGIVNVHCYAPITGKFNLRIYNILGQEVYSEEHLALQEGEYNLRWDSGRKPSGVYVMSVQFIDSNGGLINYFNKKITLVK